MKEEMHSSSLPFSVLDVVTMRWQRALKPLALQQKQVIPFCLQLESNANPSCMWQLTEVMLHFTRTALTDMFMRACCRPVPNGAQRMQEKET